MLISQPENRRTAATLPQRKTVRKVSRSKHRRTPTPTLPSLPRPK